MIPNENPFLKDMSLIDTRLQMARAAHSAAVEAPDDDLRALYLQNCHVALESAHDALVSLLAKFPERP